MYEYRFGKQKKKARPALAEEIGNLKDYDIIFLGCPNRCGNLPMAVYTSPKNNDFSGKTIIPLCTHAGSGLSNTVRTVASKCPQSTVLNGFSMSVQTAQKSRYNAKRDTLKWIDGIKLD